METRYTPGYAYTCIVLKQSRSQTDHGSTVTAPLQPRGSRAFSPPPRRSAPRLISRHVPEAAPLHHTQQDPPARTLGTVWTKPGCLPVRRIVPLRMLPRTKISFTFCEPSTTKPLQLTSTLSLLRPTSASPHHPLRSHAVASIIPRGCSQVVEFGPDHRGEPEVPSVVLLETPPYSRKHVMGTQRLELSNADCCTSSRVGPWGAGTNVVPSSGNGNFGFAAPRCPWMTRTPNSRNKSAPVRLVHVQRALLTLYHFVVLEQEYSRLSPRTSCGMSAIASSGTTPGKRRNIYYSWRDSLRRCLGRRGKSFSYQIPLRRLEGPPLHEQKSRYPHVPPPPRPSPCPPPPSSPNSFWLPPVVLSVLGGPSSWRSEAAPRFGEPVRCPPLASLLGSNRAIVRSCVGGGESVAMSLVR